MTYLVILIDRQGHQSPALECEIFCDGTEFEIDAELYYEHVKTARYAHVVQDNQVISEHEILGYSFLGDTIISGVHASRCGKYVITVSRGN